MGSVIIRPQSGREQATRLFVHTGQILPRIAFLAPVLTNADLRPILQNEARYINRIRVRVL